MAFDGIPGISITQLAGLLPGEVAVKASPNSKPDIVPPDLCSIFDHMKRNIMCDINKVSIGKISSFNQMTQTAQIELVFMRVIGEELIKYPTLVDVPCICLQGNGGDSRITVPIYPGDTALVLFCDRDIDNWFAGADVSEPNSERLHDLSDGIALVGLGRGLPSYNQDGPEMKQGKGYLKIKGNKVKIANDSFSYGFELAANFVAKILMTASTIVHNNQLFALYTALAGDPNVSAGTRDAASTAAGGNTAHQSVLTAQGAVEVQTNDNIGMVIDGSGV